MPRVVIALGILKTNREPGFQLRVAHFALRIIRDRLALLVLARHPTALPLPIRVLTALPLSVRILLLTLALIVLVTRFALRLLLVLVSWIVLVGLHSLS
jgi:hypothetical protein